MIKFRPIDNYKTGKEEKSYANLGAIADHFAEKYAKEKKLNMRRNNVRFSKVNDVTITGWSDIYEVRLEHPKLEFPIMIGYCTK